MPNCTVWNRFSARGVQLFYDHCMTIEYIGPLLSQSSAEYAERLLSIRICHQTATRRGVASTPQFCLIHTGLGLKENAHYIGLSADHHRDVFSIIFAPCGHARNKNHVRHTKTILYGSPPSVKAILNKMQMRPMLQMRPYRLSVSTYKLIQCQCGRTG